MNKIVNKIIYNFTCSIKAIVRNKFVNMLIVLSLFFGLLFPGIILGFGNDGISKIKSSLKNDLDRTFVFSIKSRKLTDEDIDYIIRSNNQIEAITREIGISANITTDKGNYETTIVCVDDSYSKFYDGMIEEGIFFQKEDYDNRERKCIIGTDLSKNDYAGGWQGKMVKINGVDFEIIGVTNVYSFREMVICPLSSIETIIDKEIKPGYIVKIKRGADFDYARKSIEEFIQINFLRIGNSGNSNGNTSLSQNSMVNINPLLINNINNSVSGDDFQSKAAIELFGNDLSKAYEIVTVVFVVTLVVLMYSLINIINIIISKSLHDRRNIGIKIALGCTKTDNFLQNFFELFILSTVSAIAVFAVIPLISGIIEKVIFEINVNYNILLILELMSFIISIAISLYINRKTLGFNVAEILREDYGK